MARKLETVEKLRALAKRKATPDEHAWVDGMIADYYGMVWRCASYEKAMKFALERADEIEKRLVMEIST